MVSNSRALEDTSARQQLAESRAVARWRPRQRWYHPAIARTVITTSRFVMRRMNKLDVEGIENFEAVQERGGRGLLTFSNHVSLFDDPLLISNFVRGPYSRVRWIGADALNFFGSPFKAWLFTAGRAAPIVRGGGIDQPGMRLLRDRLLAGDWVHMFPEGGRTRDPEGRMLADFKAGAGWLIAETRPIALPFYHYGMHRVLPVGATRPRSGNRVRVVFGSPLDCDDDWVRRVASEKSGPALWEGLSSETHDILAGMERAVHPAFSSTPHDPSRPQSGLGP